jgi:alkaline phosphatase D
MKTQSLLVITLLTLFVAVLAPRESNGENFGTPWASGTSRVWPGPGLYTNRFLDWRIVEGRLECVTGEGTKPMRTAHLLSHAAAGKKKALTLSVRTGLIEPGGPLHENTWTGFLIGVGGSHVDYRTSALCHHWPGEDGGLIVALDGTGQVVFRDNTRGGPNSPSAEWRGGKADAWRALEVDYREGPGFEAGTGMPAAVDLVLEAIPDGNEYTVSLTATEAGTDDVISAAIATGVPREMVDGNVALASHSSPRKKGRGYWYRNWKGTGDKLEAHRERELGPIVSTQYTLSEGVLKMTAQMTALGSEDTQGAVLQVKTEAGGPWRTVAKGKLEDHSFTIPFRVEDWDAGVTVPYRVAYDLRVSPERTRKVFFAGRIRKDPVDKKEVVVAAFTGHHISAQGGGSWNFDSIWYPHNELVEHVRYHKADLLFFSGDQIYEGGLSGIVREPAEEACVDYLYHWIRWCWAFRDLARDRPTICLPDDHDVYHGNIWGSGGKAATGAFGKEAQDSGGYQMAPLFVNAVHRTQVSHLPDAYDATPIDQGISVYYTSMEYGGLSFAIIADRMWKSSPSVLVPEGGVKNGWFEAPGFDIAKDSDVPGAVLLGNRQLRFLGQWANDWSHGEKMKVLLSQTIFNNVATLPKEAINDTVVPTMTQPTKPGEYMEGDKTVGDGDSNGWPQTGRDKAVRALRKGFVFHIAGDQHLASFIRYGVDEWDDAGYAVCVPSIANVWPRRWFPPVEGGNRLEGAPRYTGEFKDGFGNKLTVHAVANPSPSGQEPAALYDRMPGYGIVRFDKGAREIGVEVWPRWVDPSEEGAAQYPGWPVTVSQFDNYDREAAAFLPTVVVHGMEDAVVQVIDEEKREKLYTVRMLGKEYAPRVFSTEGTYTVRVGEPGTKRMKTLRGLAPQTPGKERDVHVRFGE